MADEIVQLPGSRYARYALPLDYPPSRDLRPRWGNTHPPIAALYDWFSAHAAEYDAFLEEMARSVPHLASIPRDFSPDQLPEPAWFEVPFAPFDSLALYTMVRLRRPRTYIEIGSGISTCFAAKAVRDHGLETRIVSIDPQPRAAIDGICDEVIREGLETCDLGIFTDLRAGDIVFIDGSHRSFMNSDVTVFMIDVLPRLRPGVVVHLHDITLPWDYPDMFVDWYWNEQYLLAAYMIGARERLDPILPTQFVCRDPRFAERQARPFIDFGDDDLNSAWRGGGSMWFAHKLETPPLYDAAGRGRSSAPVARLSSASAGTTAGKPNAGLDAAEGPSLSEQMEAPAFVTGREQEEASPAQPAQQARREADIASRIRDAHNATVERDWENAANRWEVIRRESPDLAVAYLEGGWALREADRLDEADAVLSAGIGRFPDDPWMAVHYGWVAMRRKDWPEAAARWDRVRARFPDNPVAWVEGGWALREADRLDEADAVSSAGIERFPDNPWPAVHYGWVAMRRRDWQEAARRWDAARQRFPDHDVGYVDGGWALLEAGRLDEAEGVLAAAIEKFPQSSSAALHYARAAALRGHHREAVARWQTVTDRFPNVGGMPQEISRALLKIASSEGGNGAPPGVAGLTARIEAIRGLSNDEIEKTGLDRLTARIQEILTDPEFASWPVGKQLPMIERVQAIYTWYHHASGRSLIPALERLLHRALAIKDLPLDTLCLFYDLMYFLHWYWASSWEAMRGVTGVMAPVAGAIRDGAVLDLPTIAPRALGREPLRIGYLAQFVLLGNPIGSGVGEVLEGLSRYFPGTYKLVLYAWSQYDDASLAPLIERGITVRRFIAGSMSERIAVVADAVAADEIDILITDMNSALPTVLFERRIAPVQIFFQNGLPFWPLANIDGVFRIEFYDPRLDGFDREICFDLGLGPWNQPGYPLDPPVDPARIAAERARFPRDAKLAGIYGRLAKITPDFLQLIETLLVRHPQLVVALGGTGEGNWIHDFIIDHGLTGRLVLVDEYVDGHVWGHVVDIFLDTSWDVTVAGREIMAKSKPIVSMRTPTHEHERVPMLIADNRAMYIDLVSRLIEDRALYEAACAATRDFVAAQPGEREFAAAVDQALKAIVGRVRSGAATVDARRLIKFNRLEPRSVLDLLKSEKSQAVETVNVPGGKPVEVVRVDELIYLPERHLQVWRNHIIPVEANTDPDAVPLIFSGNYQVDVRTHKDLLVVNTLDEEVCILSNLHSYNFYHFIEELYKVVVLERNGFAGKYVVSPFPSSIAASLPTFALELLRLLGIPEERMLSVAAPTLFRNAWLTSHIAHNNVAGYPAVFFALRDTLLAAAEGPSLGPRLWLDRGGRHRAVVNREEVDECLRRHGVTAVEMSELPVARQIAAVAAADTLVGPHGAAFVHSMFLQERSTVIECFSPEYLHPCMLDICALLGHRYFNLTYPAAPSYETGQLAARLYKYGGDIAVDCNHLDFLLQSLTAVHDAPSTTVGWVGTQPKSAERAPNPDLDRLSRRSVLDELKSSAPSRVMEVDFGPGGKPVEIGAAGEVLYLPALHLQLWRNTVVPSEANFAAYAFIELQDDIRLGDIQPFRPLDEVDEIDGEVCILSNLYANNFFHFFEELYKVTILERSGFQGRYVLSPFGDRHSSGLPPFATGFLELLGIRDDRIIMCRKPTVFRSSWLTTPIGCWDTIAYRNLFLALRAALIAAATAIASGIGPRLYLERSPPRVVVNAQEVRERVGRYGFTTVNMATLPIAEQIAAAHHAEVLVGPHGSSMLHCAFQEKKSTVIECFSPEYMDFFILDILHILEHHYYQIVAMDRRMVVRYSYGEDVEIDCHHLELVLKQLP
ncbi:MAG TPA: glycosyltransferase 61 family protein [Stellaceae bacterium]|nr:glycosyltransferase 61 family protein [Stellaceae bacterium]